MEKKEMNLTEYYSNRLISVLVELSNIESEMREFSDRLQEVDKKRTTLDHYLENEGVSYAGSKAFNDEKRSVLQLRRNIKQVYEIMKHYQTHKNKILNIENRQFLITEINKKTKELLNCKYNYQEEYYTKEFLDELTKKKRKDENDNE